MSTNTTLLRVIPTLTHDSDIPSDILSGSIYWCTHTHTHTYMYIYMLCIIFWHSLWHIFWHSFRHLFWHSIWLNFDILSGRAQQGSGPGAPELAIWREEVAPLWKSRDPHLENKVIGFESVAAANMDEDLGMIISGWYAQARIPTLDQYTLVDKSRYSPPKVMVKPSNS